MAVECHVCRDVACYVFRIAVMVFRVDVARNVSTTGVEIGYQARQGAVGLAPHQAVDGGQFGGCNDWG